MSRNERINKLGNAIKRYRGRFDPVSGKWEVTPKPLEADKVKSWLLLLNMNVAESMKIIDSFRTLKDYNKFMKGLK